MTPNMGSVSTFDRWRCVRWNQCQNQNGDLKRWWWK